jgi:signal transduction histidine kinase/ActR/RegA family two-component response regulator
VVGGGTAFFLGATILVVLAILNLRNDAIETVKKESARLGIVLAEQTTRALQSADIEISQISREILRKRLSNINILSEYYGNHSGFLELKNRLVDLPQVDWISIIDANGKLVVTTRIFPTPEINLSDREYFDYIKNNDVLISQISEPLRSRSDGVLSFYLSRRINAPDGSFLAVVNASIRINYFQELYAQLGLEKDAAITLMRRDGIVITRYPQGSATSGQRLPLSHPFTKAVANGGGFYVTESIFEDDGTRFVSVSPLQTYPIVIDVVRSERQALAQWRRQAIEISAGLACALTALLALLFALNRQFVSLEDAQTAIAERKKALTLSAAQLTVQANVLQSTLDNMSDGLIMVDATGHVAVFNNRALELLDLPIELMEEKPTFEQIARYQRDIGEFNSVSESLKLKVANHNYSEIALLAYERERPNGTILEIRSVQLLTGGIVRTYTDVTQTRRQDIKMREAQRYESLGRLAGGIAHDFNNLLGAISLNTEVLTIALADWPEQLESAKIISTAVESGGGLIRRLLAYSRQQDLAAESFDLAAYLTDQIQLIRRTIGDDISVIADIASDLPPVEADASRVGDALLNVAINARDAMPNGGRLLIRAYRDPEEVDGENGFVVLAVTDTGTGMSPETLAQATEPYFTTKPFGTGTGLGLSMVEGFVRQTGGKFRIRSAPGEGTTISMSLPCSTRKPTVPTPQHVDDERGVERLLIVDDNESMRQALARILAGLGYDVSVASSGHEAMLRLVDAGPFDLLLTDLAMPDGMSGIDLAEQASLRCPSMPTLLMSGNVPPDLRSPSLPELHFLNKPFRRNELATAIRFALSSKKSAPISPPQSERPA